MLSYVCFQNMQYVQNTTSKAYGTTNRHRYKDRNTGNMFQDPWWMPETADSTKPCRYDTMFFPI